MTIFLDLLFRGVNFTVFLLLLEFSKSDYVSNRGCAFQIESDVRTLYFGYDSFLRTLLFKRPPDPIFSRASNRGGIQWTTIFTDPSSTRIRNNPIQYSHRRQIQWQSNNSQASYLYETCSLLLGSDNFFLN